MNAAGQLFDYLGSPRGQVVVYLADSTKDRKELVVWKRHDFDRRNIPSSFKGYRVIVEDMPHVTGQYATRAGTFLR